MILEGTQLSTLSLRLYYGLHRSRSVRVAPAIELKGEDEAELVRLVHSKVSSVRLAERARIALLAAQGLQNLQIAQELGVARITAGRWRQRYIESGIAGIERDLPRGAPPA